MLLLDTVFFNPTLWNVIQSVTRNGQSMLLTSMFALIMVYFFSIVGFVYVQDDFRLSVSRVDQNDTRVEEMDEPACDTLLACITTTLNHGLRNGGGVGDILRQPSQTEDLYAFRVIYDMAFFFLLIVIVLNLILGIIIDTFADLRKEKQEKDELRRNTCFICGLERKAFDSKGLNFERHCRVDHHLWSYLNFVVLLRVSWAELRTWRW